MFCYNGLAIASGNTYIALLNAIINGICVRVPVACILVYIFNMGFDGIALAMGFASVGGILIGVIEILGKTYISSQLADAIVFGVLILVLMFKPTGILGKKISEKV